MLWRAIVVLVSIATLVSAQDPRNFRNPAANSDRTKSAESEEEKPEPKWTITAECRMILAPQALALSFMPKLTSKDKAIEGWHDVDKAIAADQVKLIASLISRSAEGQRTVSESVEEVMYPTEFDPPNLPDKVPEQNAAEILRLWPAVSITPTAFQARNAGQTFELKTTINADGSFLLCDISAQHTRLLRWAKFVAGKLANGGDLSVEQPIFHVMKNTTQISLANGQVLLLGIHKAPPPEEGFEMFIMQIRAERNGAK